MCWLYHSPDYMCTSHASAALRREPGPRTVELECVDGIDDVQRVDSMDVLHLSGILLSSSSLLPFASRKACHPFTSSGCWCLRLLTLLRGFILRVRVQVLAAHGQHGQMESGSRDLRWHDAQRQPAHGPQRQWTPHDRRSYQRTPQRTHGPPGVLSRRHADDGVSGRKVRDFLNMGGGLS